MIGARRTVRWRGGAAFAAALAMFAACTDFNGLVFSPNGATNDGSAGGDAGPPEDGPLGQDSLPEQDAVADARADDDLSPTQDGSLLHDSESDAAACTGPGLSFNPLNGHCYRFTPILLGWMAARSDCQQWGADLVSITDAMEETFVDNIINPETASDAGDAGPDYAWIGLEKGDAGYVWSDGEPIGFTDWAGAEPTGKPCVVHYNAHFSDHWASYQCNVNAPYVCERP
jgi:hypothetical protein